MAQSLKKNIGLWSAVSIVIGGIIGAGIFMRPASMAERLGSPVLLLVVWLVGGAVSLVGAMIYAELGTMFPDTGGPYIYLQKTYGDFTAFLYGWSTMAVINTAAIASIAFVCAQYAGFFIHLPRLPPEIEHSVKLHIPYLADIYPLENFGVKLLTSGIIVVLILVNYLSTRYGNAIQVVTTVMKTLALTLLIGGILLSGKGHPANFVTSSPGFHPGSLLLMVGFMGAISGAFSSYDGWNNVNMVAGEIENPQRNISRSLFIGVGICIAVYVLTTLAYNYVLPVAEMAKSPLVAADAMEKVVGVAAAGLVSGLIAFSAFGATHVNLLTNARITFAMGEEGSFFPWTGVVHRRFGTPGNAVIVIGAWSILFVWSGSFDILADMFVFMSWVFYGLTGLGLFILRKRIPEATRPYRVWGYPWLPLVFVAFTLFYLVTTIYGDVAAYRSGKSPVINSVFGLALTAAGIPFYLYFQRKRRNHEK
ncbi:MAG TPA: amino acid permease [Puia sp.]|jgi:APA family basic amino acid/polyamine antiporter|nr:amino acid permease [Puia sp.]